MKASDRSRIYTVICAASAALWTLFIFSNSLKNGSSSSSMSAPPVSMLSALFENLRLNIDVHTVTIFVRKAAHMTEYAVLGVLVSSAFHFHSRSAVKRGVTILFICVLAAMCDELIQAFIPGRSSEVSDVFIDLCGAAIGFGVMSVIYKLKKGE